MKEMLRGIIPPVITPLQNQNALDFESLQVAGKADDFGADAVIAAPPYYFVASQSELVRYFQLLADESPLPLFLYNMPSHTKVHLEQETNHENKYCKKVLS